MGFLLYIEQQILFHDHHLFQYGHDCELKNQGERKGVRSAIKRKHFNNKKNRFYITRKT